MNAINYEERSKVYAQALNTFGANAQLVKAIEEMTEAIKEICRALLGENNREHLAEEVADATIMLEQIRQICGINDLVCDYMDAKITRLEGYIQQRRADQDRERLEPDEAAKLFARFAERERGHG